MFANRNDGHLLSLPIGEHLTEQELADIADAVKTFCVQAVTA